MSVVMLAVVTFALITSVLLVVTAGLLIQRDRRSFGLITDRLLVEQRIDAATLATLQAMRDAARLSQR